jgi:hypothetical protein
MQPKTCRDLSLCAHENATALGAFFGVDCLVVDMGSRRSLDRFDFGNHHFIENTHHARIVAKLHRTLRCHGFHDLILEVRDCAIIILRWYSGEIAGDRKMGDSKMGDGIPSPSDRSPD